MCFDTSGEFGKNRASSGRIGPTSKKSDELVTNRMSSEEIGWVRISEYRRRIIIIDVILSLVSILLTLLCANEKHVRIE